MTLQKKRPDKGNCKVYTADDSYAKCIDDKIRKKMHKLLGCIPPMMSSLSIDNNINICNKPIIFEGTIQNFWFNLKSSKLYLIIIFQSINL